MFCYLLSVCWGGMMVYTALADTAQSAPESADSTLNFTLKYSKLLDASQLANFKMMPSVGTVYFYKTGSTNWTDEFLASYDKSAGFLDAYGLQLGLVDCSGTLSTELEEECSEADGETVYTYREGKELLTLEMSTMFDVDSIMANILILALVNKVSIVQSKASRQEMERDHAGQSLVVLAYHDSVGTAENRAFMEIAYAYHDKHKFAITSEHVATVGLQDADQLGQGDSSPPYMIWVLYCQDRYSADDGCRSVNYRGNTNLMDLALFFKRLEWPKVVYLKEDGAEKHPCQDDDSVGCVIVTHSPAAKEEADPIIDSLQFDIHGIAGLMVKHVDDKNGAKVLSVTIQVPGGQDVILEDDVDLETIEVAVAKHLLPEKPSTGQEAADPTTIDDMVVQVAFNNRHSIADVPLIPAMTDKTFPVTTKDNNKKLVVVLFYLPFDAQGMVFLKPYEEAGRKLAAMNGNDPLAHPLVRVNCFDWTDVCQKENITTYPVVYIYWKGGQREQYRHALDTDVLVRTVKLLQADQPLMLKTGQQVTDFLSGRLPTSAYSDIDNLVILKLSKSRQEMERYQTVVKSLQTQMLFAIAEPGTTSLVADGGVLLKRSKDQEQPLQTLTKHSDAAAIIEFLQNRQFSLFPELTFMNFPALYARKQPFAILFYEPSVPTAKDVHQTIISLLLSEKLPHMVFCKMTVGESNPEAKPLLLNYTSSEELPAFTIINHDKGQVFVLQGKEMGAVSLLPWIQAVQQGEVVPAKILDKGEWKPPGQHYDFLALIDEEKMKKMAKEQTPPQSEESQQESDPHLQDVETRTSLLELQRSRLYSVKDRKRQPSSGQSHPEHVEL